MKRRRLLTVCLLILFGNVGVATPCCTSRPRAVAPGIATVERPIERPRPRKFTFESVLICAFLQKEGSFLFVSPPEFDDFVSLMKEYAYGVKIDDLSVSVYRYAKFNRTNSDQPKLKGVLSSYRTASGIPQSTKTTSSGEKLLRDVEKAWKESLVCDVRLELPEIKELKRALTEKYGEGYWKPETRNFSWKVDGVDKTVSFALKEPAKN